MIGQPLVVASDDQTCRPLHRFAGTDRTVDVGRLGIVVYRRPAIVANVFEPVFWSIESRQAARDRLVARAVEFACRDSRKTVREIVLPDKFYAVKSAYALCSAPVVETYVRPVDIRAAALAASGKEICLRLHFVRDRNGDRVVGVEHRPVSAVLRFEQPRLDARIFGKTAVSVEMIGRDVEKNRYVRAYPAVFQHKTRHLYDRNAETRHVRPLCGKRYADVADRPRLCTVGAKYVFDERHGGRLAVGAADRDLPRRTDCRRKLQFRKHRYPLFAERGKQRMIDGHGRARYRKSRVFGDLFDTLVTAVTAAVVVQQMIDPGVAQQFCGGDAARARAQYQRLFTLGDACPQRLCNVLSRKFAHSSRHIAAASSATAPATAVTIVYWATILLSLTPLYSR